MKIKSYIVVSTYSITFSYITKRNNNRELMVEIDAAIDTDAEFWFWMWISQHNKKNPDKPYNNVSILNKKEIDRNRYIKSSKNTFTINQDLD